MTRRHFLILQALATPFMTELAARLRVAGHDTTKVHLCGADLMFWRGPALTFRRSADAWPEYLRAVMQRLGVTDVILFGDCRPYHRVAVSLAKQCGATVHVFEEGYLRPGCITLEIGGTNGFSSFPRDPGEVLRLARELPEASPIRPMPSSFFNRALWDVAAQSLGLVLTPVFPHYRWHGTDHPFTEYGGWLWRFVRAPFGKATSDRTIRKLLASGKPFFFVPLQLNSDYQIRVHSRFDSLLEAIEEIIRSFARHAPPDAVLLLKRHPLDPGLIPYRRRIARIARRANVASRVKFVITGDLAQLIPRSQGVVLVNSTVGLAALQMGRRVMALGHALYGLPGLTFQGALDDFWTATDEPDPVLCAAFAQLLLARTQVQGDFFSAEGIETGARNAADRILSFASRNNSAMEPSAANPEAAHPALQPAVAPRD